MMFVMIAVLIQELVFCLNDALVTISPFNLEVAMSFFFIIVLSRVYSGLTAECETRQKRKISFS